MSPRKPTFIDLFAGAGGLSEGFIRAGFEPVAHVEKDSPACFTLKTRTAYYYLKATRQSSVYVSYLRGEISRDELYKYVPTDLHNSVINAAIGGEEDKVIHEGIRKQLKGRKVDLIIGGPPCQAYSYIGRAALKHKTDDERTKLYIQYGRFLKKYRPKIFVFENVPGLLTAGDGQHFKNLQMYYKRLGYTVEARKLNANDYGVVQHRERLIIIGWRKKLNFKYPALRKSTKNNSRDDIFSDLPIISTNETARFHKYSGCVNDYLKTSAIRNGIDIVSQHITRPHNKKDLAIYRLAIQKLNEGIRLKNSQIPDKLRTQNNVTDFLDRFKVVSDLPHAIIAHIAKDGHHFIHPDENQLRSISVREAARIQSFPDDFYFEAVKEGQSRTAAFRQIGNAVPPLLAYKIAGSLKRIIQRQGWLLK